MIAQIRVDITGALKMLNQARTEKIPLAARSALNKMARLSIPAMQRRVRLLYKLRSDWVVSERRFEIQPAHRNNLTATIIYGPDYWALHEGGGYAVKTPHAHAHIAVPIGPWAWHAIPRALRPKALMAAAGGRLHYFGEVGGAIRRSMKKTGGFGIGAAFLIGRGATSYIAVRTDNASIGVPSRSKGVRLLYWLTPAVRFARMLNMRQTVESVVRTEFAAAFADYMRQAENWS
jgi:hypothetical protein